ncbi:MAG: hypothetical protein EBQ94_01670 [Flavobacteriales bacterium]|nr:hypothetical protein [Crocinitomicaceae bacterium]NBX79078.1 hypothetical protein [Flavobacteriales bacterium]
MLFAIDKNTDEIIVSESPKGSNKINTVERIKREDNVILYNAVVTLSIISSANNLDVPLFKAMDKVCQLIYKKHKEIV